jgi:hypothetical protein
MREELDRIVIQLYNIRKKLENFKTDNIVKAIKKIEEAEGFIHKELIKLRR